MNDFRHRDELLAKCRGGGHVQVELHRDNIVARRCDIIRGKPRHGVEQRRINPAVNNASWSQVNFFNDQFESRGSVFDYGIGQSK